LRLKSLNIKQIYFPTRKCNAIENWSIFCSIKSVSRGYKNHTHHCKSIQHSSLCSEFKKVAWLQFFSQNLHRIYNDIIITRGIVGISNQYINGYNDDWQLFIRYYTITKVTDKTVQCVWRVRTPMKICRYPVVIKAGVSSVSRGDGVRVATCKGPKHIPTTTGEHTNSHLFSIVRRRHRRNNNNNNNSNIIMCVRRRLRYWQTNISHKTFRCVRPWALVRWRETGPTRSDRSCCCKDDALLQLQRKCCARGGEPNRLYSILYCYDVVIRLSPSERKCDKLWTYDASGSDFYPLIVSGKS